MEKKEQLWSNIIERKWKDSVVAVDVVVYSSSFDSAYLNKYS